MTQIKGSLQDIQEKMGGMLAMHNFLAVVKMAGDAACRIASKYGTADPATAIQIMIAFLELNKNLPDAEFIPSMAIDAALKTLAEDTEKYTRFCKALLDVSVPHQPRPPYTPENHQRYLKTGRLMLSVCGTLDRVLWPGWTHGSYDGTNPPLSRRPEQNIPPHRNPTGKLYR